ncbi:hypothetical protein FQN57_005103 [Myotisia sp. PD_48]|nr:hypothetical protein FQN57_005103 [Myotisia sp. PD_48]
MANHQADEAEEVKLLIGFASSLYSRFPILANADLIPLPEAIADNISRAQKIQSGPLELGQRKQLDELGIKVWNACTKALVRHDLEKEQIQWLHRAKVFSFLLIECAAGDDNGGEGDHSDIRILKTGLKAVKSSLELGLPCLGALLLERLLFRKNRLSEIVLDLEAADGAIEMIMEDFRLYYHIVSHSRSCTRSHGAGITGVWMQLVEDGCMLPLDPTSSDKPLPEKQAMAVTVANILYDLGERKLDLKEYHSAVGWLQKAYDVVSNHSSHDFNSLKFDILHKLIRANLHLEKSESIQSASHFLELLEQHYANEPSVILLSLEVFTRQKPVDSQKYHDRLETVIPTLPIDEHLFELICYHIHQLCELSLILASRLLKSFILSKLLDGGNSLLLERAFVFYVSMHTKSDGLESGLHPISTFISMLESNSPVHFSMEASQSSLILIWKKVIASIEAQDFTLAEQWCKLSNNSIFAQAGDMNKNKIQRKLLLGTIQKPGRQFAVQMALDIEKQVEPDPMMQYLIFLAMLKNDNFELASKSFRSITRSVSAAPQYTISCMTEARAYGKEPDLRNMLISMTDGTVQEKLNNQDCRQLLQCIIRSLLFEIDTVGGENLAPVVERICGGFERLWAYSLQEQKCGTELHISDLEWISRNSYNLALKHCTKWEQQHTLRLLEISLKTTEIYPPDMGVEAIADLRIRGLMCNFLAAAVSIAQARIQKNLELQVQSYVESRRYIQRFRAIFREGFQQINSIHQVELLDKYRTLIAFDFEAALKLQHWDSFSDMFFEIEQLAEKRLFSALANIVLTALAPVDKLVDIFQELIRIAEEGCTYSMDELSRWFRCLFQLALQHDSLFAQEVLSQVCQMANSADADKPEGESTYPDEELEWLSTTTYNRAIDFYLASDDTASHLWYQKALDLANLMKDNGSLSRILEEKFLSLNWNDTTPEN